MPDWLTADMVVKIVQAMFTLFLGIMAVLIARRQVEIAHRQAETANDKLKLDLYDRRYEVYRKFMALVQKLFPDEVSDEEFHKRLDAIAAKEFLFDAEFNEWMDGLIKLTMDVRKEWRSLERARKETGEDAEIKRYEKNDSFSRTKEQYDKTWAQATKMFMPYLDFSKNL